VLEYGDDLDIEKMKEQVGIKSFILSTLFPHECKLSVMHFKISRHFENTEPVPSKHDIVLHCGFRVFYIKPVFS
jgi:pre-rRNA-processing protein TSR1